MVEHQRLAVAHGMGDQAQQYPVPGTMPVREQFAVVGRWDDIPDALTSRYAGTATRLVSYLAEESLDTDALAPARWGAIA